MAWRSWRSRRPRLPAPVVDAGLAVALALAVTVAINVSPSQGEPPDALAYQELRAQLDMLGVKVVR